MNDSVTAGKMPWWLISSGSLLRVKRATVLSGTCAPERLDT